MPSTKNSEIRIKVIDRCLRIGGFSTQDILLAVNDELKSKNLPIVKALNTIRADMRYISSQPGIEIIKDEFGTSATYRYADPESSIYKLQLNENEIGQLTQCMAMLSKFEGMPQMEWIESFIERFRDSIDIDSDWNVVVGFDENKYLKGLELFNPLLQAILRKEAIELKYKSFRDKMPQKIIVHPYFLKEYNNRWFLIAKTEGREDLSTYAFDRIDSIQKCHKIKYRQNTEYDFNDDYFSDMVGVSKPKKYPVNTVTLWISPKRAPYVETKPIHESQKLKKNPDGSAIVTLNLYVNRELEQLILSFCDDIKVISPEFLVDKIRNRFLSALDRYDSMKL